MIKKLINRLFWWSTEDVYEKGISLGIMIGASMEQERIIKALDEADSACSGWAIWVIKEGQNESN